MNVRKVEFRNMLGALFELDKMRSHKSGFYYEGEKLDDNLVLNLKVNGVEVGKYVIGKMRRGLDDFKKKVYELNGVLEKNQGFASAIGTIISLGRDYRAEIKNIADQCFV